MEEGRNAVKKIAQWLAIEYNPHNGYKIRCSACSQIIYNHNEQINPPVCPRCGVRMTNFRDNPTGWMRAMDTYSSRKVHV
jgi:rRNA maturation endonuclease Nob1